MQRVVQTSFGIEVDCPEHWQDRAEAEDTHLFWDAYTGSLRVTLQRIDRKGFDGAAFLEAEARQKAALRPRWRQLGERRFLCYVEDQPKDDGVTRLHYYLWGQGPVLLICSWAYDASLLDDELSEMEVEGETETAEAMLASLRFS